MAAREIAAIDDPLSRLIACGVWVRYLPSDETILQIGISTASANGWRRPLWAYLNKLQEHYLETGDKNKAAAIKDKAGSFKKEIDAANRGTTILSGLNENNKFLMEE